MNRVMIAVALVAAGLTAFSRSGARIRAFHVAQDKEDLARWEDEGGAPHMPSVAAHPADTAHASAAAT